MLTKLGFFMIEATATSKDCGQMSTAVAASADALFEELFRPLFSLPVTLEIGGRKPDTNEIWARTFWVGKRKWKFVQLQNENSLHTWAGFAVMANILSAYPGNPV